MASRQRDFVNKVYNEARAAGLPDPQARLAAAQAALETGYGKSSVGNNYFGIKAGTSWNGPSVAANTWEDVGGQRVNQKANFRAYEDPGQSFHDWAGVVGRNWSDALAAPDFNGAVEGLNYGRPGGYASDQAYGSKLRSIDRMYGPNVQEMGLLNGVPTPTARPEPTYTDPMAGYRASDVQKVSMSAPAAQNFDMGRFGPAPVSTQTLATQQPQGPTFDAGRFGPQPTGPTPSFDPRRFGAPAPVAQGMEALRQGLLDQQLNEGILPSLQYSQPLSPSLQPPAQPGYVDPQVTTAPLDTATRQPGYTPTSVKQAAVQAPPPSQVQSGLMSMPEYNQVMAAGGFTPAVGDQALAARVAQGISQRKTAGGLLGGLLGGLTLGPVGAIAGGLLGGKVAQNSYFPEAPTPPNGVKRTGQSGNGGFGGLSDYGRSVAGSSGQFHDAVSSGKSGLW